MKIHKNTCSVCDKEHNNLTHIHVAGTENPSESQLMFQVCKSCMKLISDDYIIVKPITKSEEASDKVDSIEEFINNIELVSGFVAFKREAYEKLLKFIESEDPQHHQMPIVLKPAYSMNLFLALVMTTMVDKELSEKMYTSGFPKISNNIISFICAVMDDAVETESELKHLNEFIDLCIEKDIIAV